MPSDIDITRYVVYFLQKKPDGSLYFDLNCYCKDPSLCKENKASSRAKDDAKSVKDEALCEWENFKKTKHDIMLRLV